MRRRVAALAVLVLMAGGALVGCGSDEGEAPAAETSVAALQSTSSGSTTTSLRAAGPPLEATAALAQIGGAAASTAVANVAAEVDLATWALRVCGATALVDAAAFEVFSDGLDGTALTLEARVQREVRITSAVGDAARSAASAVAAVDPPPGGGAYQARVTLVLEDLAALLDEAGARISTAQSEVDVAEAYATLARDIGPELVGIRADAQALDPTLAGALRATSRCAAFSGFGAP